MAIIWTGTIDVAAGQPMVTSTIVTSPTRSFIVRLEAPQIDLLTDFAYTNRKFFYEVPATDFITSVEALDLAPDSDMVMFRIGLVAGADGALDVSWSVVAGDASLEQPYLAAE